MELNYNMTVAELKEYKQKVDEDYINSINNTKRLNDILIERLERKTVTAHPTTTEKVERLKGLVEKLSDLISEKLQLSQSIESKHADLKKLYLENRDKVTVDHDHEEKTADIPTSSDLERDKALGLVKVLLATVKSSRMQSEENFHKLKYSADLMFHVMYKAEDAFLKEDHQ